MRLYHSPLSSNARRAVMTAVHLNQPVELVSIDLSSTEQRKQLLAVNPNEKIPVLVDGDFILWESCAIMQYLAEKTPGQTIYPTDLHARADVNRWLFWTAQHFSPAIEILNWENWIKAMIGAGAPDAAAIRHGEEQLAIFASTLDAHLAGREWVVGSGLTLADFAIAAPLMSTVMAKLPVRQYRNLQAWFERVQALDAWQKTAP
ncbi:glutathione S-transferase family protein [Paraherbaspirillum soli]|uniref:Glutathione S-transferase family protein n=1 Tax=Paraherbaspirillum soli TaxID=631222 RepID=A0ABW0M5T5_9BURK